MKDRKKLARAVALVLAALMALTTLASALSFLVRAASIEWGSITHLYFDEGSIIQQDSVISVTFTVKASSAYIFTGDPIELKRNEFKLQESWWNTTGSTVMIIRPSDDGFVIDVNNIKYNSLNEYRTLSFGDINQINDSRLDFFNNRIVSVSIPRSYYTRSSSGNSSDDGDGGSSIIDDDKVTYTSNIVFESATVTDKNGKPLDAIDKDTEPFTVSVVYTDTGLRGAEVDNLRGTDVQTFFTPGGAFDITGTTKGTVQYMTTGSTRSNYPRFRVTFSGLTYTGTGNDLGFQVYYLFNYMDDPVKGEGKATVAEAKPEDDDDEDKDKLGMAVPKIIIDSYSYGEETIVAGSEFDLSFTIRNTSQELPLENIVITMTPTSNEAAKEGPGLTVASSSNTIYVPNLAAGASIPYTVAFQARPDAEVTSHIIQIKFSYEYIDTVKKSREASDMEESIAIPVSQIDRFSVEPILDSPYAVVGEEAYLTVSFVNRGKATTNNIVLSVRSDNPAVSAPNENYGNLEAGASDTVDLYVTSTEPGDITGEVVVEYEDENMNVKEIVTPFSMYVEEPWFPPMDDIPPDDLLDEPAPTGPGALSVVLCVIGGLAIAGPIALYLMKRVKAKGSEDFDEDF